MDILENFFSFIICNEVDLNVVVIQFRSDISESFYTAWRLHFSMDFLTANIHFFIEKSL